MPECSDCDVVDEGLDNLSDDFRLTMPPAEEGGVRGGVCGSCMLADMQSLTEMMSARLIL